MIDTKINWQSSDGIEGSELKATYGDLHIAVDDVPITRILDKRDQTARDYITVSAYPLAEWIATNWFNLLYGPKIKTIKPGSNPSNSIRHAGQGYPFPELSFNSLGRTCEITWKGYDSGNDGIEFLSRGHYTISTAQLKISLERLVNIVMLRLEAMGVHNTYLQEHWGYIMCMQEDEIAFCKASARIGYNPFLVPKNISTLLIKHSNFFNEETYDELLYALNPDELSKTLPSINSYVESMKEFQPVKFNPPKKFRRTSNILPFLNGYKLANQITKSQSIPDPIGSLGQLSSELKIPEDSLYETVAKPADTISPSILALQTIATDDRPVLRVFNNRYDTSSVDTDPGLIFKTTRAFGAYLLDSSSSINFVSSAYSDSQAANRAFAAELIMPSRFLKSKLKGRRNRPVSEELLADIAETHNVSYMVVKHQYQNHIANS